MSHRRQQKACALRTAGFTLLEVLVALLVMAIGLLGLASLQTISIKLNQGSYYRTIATFQAQEILDRARANVSGVDAGNYLITSSGVASGYGANLTPSPDCSTATCTSAQLAMYDLIQWNTANSTLLPEGEGAIDISGRTWTVTIQWTEGDQSMNHVVRARL